MMIYWASAHNAESIHWIVPVFIIGLVYLLSSHISYVYVFELCKSDHVGSKKEMKKDSTAWLPLQKQI